jgi:glycosyltransferase involved in cell wall biosynthesis
VNPPTPAFLVSAIVPARNEEDCIAAAIESLAEQPEIGEIIAVNDQSTDRTDEILAGLAARIPRLRVLQAPDLPEGWVGKNHALRAGAAEAQGEWLLFTDADAVHLPGSTAKALEVANATGSALVSFSPAQETEHWYERALIPFVFSRLSEKFRYSRINDPESPAAAANGQYVLIRRDAYDAVGGHTALAGEVLEDVELARRVKRAGYRIFFGPGTTIARVHMYRSFRAMWQGWVKNLYPLMGGTARSALGEAVGVFPWIPVACLLLGFWHWQFVLAGIALLVGRHIWYAYALRANRFSRSGIKYYVPAVILYCVVLLSSVRHYSRGAVTWKGRKYPVGMARR